MDAEKSRAHLNLYCSLRQPPSFVIPHTAFSGAFGGGGVVPEGILLDDAIVYEDFVADGKVIKSEDDYCGGRKPARNTSSNSRNGSAPAASANAIVKGQWTAEEDWYDLINYLAYFTFHS